MNFEKVELYGFKSFADKSEINFGDGITAIVGPNGCGKSNVADSIRWVLGEQSAKTLRGSSMQDFIFSGTQTRKPLSYCEASLYFDNSNHVFSIDYNEVIITRKLYRSGESEYYINKQPARLRDIINLLREVGVGKEGYTIIGQGKVSEIMTSKPEDRRAIFEEATGIAKFKQSKAENERKLDRTKENITNFTLLMSEVENRMGPLERQANKAREYNELVAQLKHHELNTYISKVENVGADKAKINEKIKSIEDESALRFSELAASAKKYDKVMEDLGSLGKELSELNRKYTDLNVAAEKKRGEDAVYDERYNFISTQTEDRKRELEENEKLLIRSREEIRTSEEGIENKNLILAEKAAEEKKLNSEIADLTDRITVGETLERESNQKMIDSIESLSDVKLQKGTAGTEINSLNERVKELYKQAEDLDKKRESLWTDSENLEKETTSLNAGLAEAKNAVLKKEAEIKEVDSKSAAIDNEIYGLNSQYYSLSTKEEFYRSFKENYQGFLPVIQELHKRGKTNPQVAEKIQGVVAELVSCDKRFETAVETALGASAQNVVTANPDDAKFLIEYLKRNALGRLTFLPITSVKPRQTSPDLTAALKERGALGDATVLTKYDQKFKNVFSSLLGNTLIADNIDNATNIAKKYRFAFKIVTLEGEVLSTQGSMTGGSKRQQSAGVLANDRKLEETIALKKETEEKLNALKANKLKCEQNFNKLSDEYDELNKKVQTVTQSLAINAEKKVALKATLEETDREIFQNSKITDAFNSRINELTKKLAQVSGSTEELEKSRTELKETAAKNSQNADSLRKRKEILTERLTAVRVETGEINLDVSSLKDRIEALKKQIEAIKNKNLELESDIKAKEEILSDIRRQQALSAITDDERAEIENVENRINSMETKSDELKKQLGILTDKRAEIQTEIDNLSDRKHTQELALTKIDSDLEYLQQSVWEDYQETYETAIKVREENYDVTAGEAEIARLRKRKQFLGDINANAIEDFKELKARYEDMQVQKKDLEDAAKDIGEALDTIKNEMATQFDDGFKKINENFGKIFKELFGGGRAMLELDYSQTDDKLEAGVEIKVEPPGKKLQKLSLYSGGEQALTAIAILFAILRLKPMAFCVLDEIEAALDEANVERFARYLKNFSKETQFIVITHRKPTMELADRLFGVTMEEKGVSKLVSIKLADALNTEDVV